MAIIVKFFASLREQIGKESVQVRAAGPRTAADVWAEAAEGRPLPANVLVAINMEYAKPQDAVADGDEVAFFPPVTGGSQ